MMYTLFTLLPGFDCDAQRLRELILFFSRAVPCLCAIGHLPSAHTKAVMFNIIQEHGVFFCLVTQGLDLQQLRRKL